MTELLPARLNRHWYNAADHDPTDPWAGVDARTTAVVLIDLINWQAHRDGFAHRAAVESGRADEADHKATRCERVVVPRLRPVLDAARRAGSTVIHSRLAARTSDCGEIVPALRDYVRAAGAHDGAWAAEPVDGLAAEGDISLVKPGSGAFTGTDLDRVLRNRGIDTVLLAGVVTDKCVLLSAAAGFDLGYRQFLVTDGTAAYRPEDQLAAERIMGSYLACPVDSSAVAAALATTAGQSIPTRVRYHDNP